MTPSRSTRAVSACLALAALGASRLAAQTGLTIYNDGRVLVRRTLPEALSAGTSNHRFSLGLLDPNSVFALDSGVAVIGSSYDASVDEENTMRRAVGTSLKFLTGGTTNGVPDTTSALVLGVGPERFRRADGRVTFQRPGLPLYPAELVLTDPTLSLAVRSPNALPALRLGYFTQGASWNASYTVVLGKNGSRVSGLASIASGSLRVSDADVQLLAGSVGRANQPQREMLMAKAMDARADNGVAQGAAEEQQIGEAHLYTIPGKISLEPGVTTGVALFEPAAAPWERSYVVRGQIPYYGMMPQYGNDENVVPVEVWYTLKRAAKTPFGDLRRRGPASAHRGIVGGTRRTRPRRPSLGRLGVRSHRQAGPDRVQHPARLYPHHRDRGLQGDAHQRQGHRGDGRGDRRALRRVGGAVELAARREGIQHQDPFPGAGARDG